MFISREMHGLHLLFLYLCFSLELARRLQEQEDRMAREGQAIQQQQSQQHRVQQQQSQSRQSHNQQLSRQHPPGGVQAENRSVSLFFINHSMIRKVFFSTFSCIFVSFLHLILQLEFLSTIK